MSLTACKVAFSLLFAAVVGQGFAQGYPAKPIHIVVPFPAGGAADIPARVIAQKMADNWGQPVIVDNRPGANTIIGAEAVAKAPPDGYTILWAIDSTLVMNQSLYAKLPYDPIRDFAPVTLTTWGQPILVVNAATGPKTVRELIQLAKANPGRMNFGSGFITNQLAGELFKSLAGVDIVYVPYKGSAPAVQGLLSEDVTMILDGVTASLPHIKSGKLRVLATLGLRPLPALPQVPTLASEAGLPGFNVAVWQGVVVPAGTAAETVNKLQQEIVRILDLADVKEKLVSMGLDTAPVSPAEFETFIRTEAERWSRLIKERGIRVE